MTAATQRQYRDVLGLADGLEPLPCDLRQTPSSTVKSERSIPGETPANHELLVVAADAQSRQEIATRLRNKGFNVVTASSSAMAMRLLATRDPHLVLIVMPLPDVDGISLCRNITTGEHAGGFGDLKRQVVVAARECTAQEVVAGFRAGARDVITDWHLQHEEVFLSRIQVLLNTPHCHASPTPQPASNAIVLGKLVIEEDNFVVRCAERQIVLTLSQFRILCLLARQPGRTFRKEEIQSSILQGASPGTVSSHIYQLRRQLGPCGKMIRTLRGVGYMLDSGND